MTYQEAMKSAARRAKKLGTWISVVFEDGDYDTATEYDLETFWNGATPLVTFGPDGFMA